MTALFHSVSPHQDFPVSLLPPLARPASLPSVPASAVSAVASATAAATAKAVAAKAALNTMQDEAPEDLAAAILSSQILVVDDEIDNIRVLRRTLECSGYKRIVATTDPRQAADLFALLQPDIVLLDMHMPHLDGLEVLEQLQAMMPCGVYLPVLVLTGDDTTSVKNRALSIGAKDFVLKPLNTTEVRLRVYNLLEARVLNQRLRNQIAETCQSMEAVQIESLRRLAEAAEFHDSDRGAHTRRVGELAALIAESLGLEERYVDLMRQAAPLHDVGKIGIPDAILLTPEKLTPDEYEVIKSHTLIGGELLRNGNSELVNAAENIARTHHERWDGRGYPCGLQREEIPLEGRITAVADVFDALTHERAYKPAWPVERSLAEIRAQSGLHFDPTVVHAFCALFESGSNSRALQIAT